MTDDPPRIDGRLDDEAWKDVRPLIDFVRCADARPSTVGTEVRLLYDRAYLYLSYRIPESELGSPRVRASIKHHDGKVWKDDRAETFFWFREGKGAGYYQLMVNMLNVTEDVKNGSTSWEPRWDSAVRLDKKSKFWTVEARIRFSEFGQAYPSPGTGWRANFGHERYAVPEHYSWAKIIGSFHQKKAFNTIVFAGRREGVPPARIANLSATPNKYSGEVVLSWTAVGDDGEKGRAAFYDMRYSTRPLTDDLGFAKATQIGDEPNPQGAGKQERFVVRHLTPGQRLYFAVKTIDDSGNAGPLASSSIPSMVPGGALNPSVLSIEPTMVCAGVVINLTPGVDLTQVLLDYRRRGSTSWKAVHHLTWIDRQHAATSLFDLEPGRDYELRIRRGSMVSVNRFKTRSEVTLPGPLRVVEVRSDAQFKAALDRARAGDEIRVHPGTYRGGLTITRSGTSDHPIVIRGVVPAREAATPAWTARRLPVIDGRGKTYNGFLIKGSAKRQVKHVILDHLQVRNAREVGVHLRHAAWCVVQHCQVYDNGKYVNVHVNKGGRHGGRNVIQFNHIADLEHGQQKYSSGSQANVTYYGFKQDNYAGPGTIVRGNLIEGHSDGIAPSGDESDAAKVSETLEDVRARWFNHSMDIYDNIIRDHADDAIEADGVAINQRVFRNKIYNAQNALSISPSMPGPFFFFANVARGFLESCVKFNTGQGRGVIRNIYFYHNTFVRGSQRTNSYTGGAIMTIWAGAPSKNIVFRNNIFTGTRGLIHFQGLAHRPDMDYDLWFSGAGMGAKNAAQSRFNKGGVTWERHGVFTDPKLDHRFRPQSPGAVRDRGIVIPGINTRYMGRAPDIGAIEVR